MVGSSLTPKWPIVVSFYGIHHQKSNFLLILAPFLPEAVEANRCYFFEIWVKKLKCPHLLMPLGTIFQHNYWSFYTSEPARFNMRHPVVKSFFYYLYRFCRNLAETDEKLHFFGAKIFFIPRRNLQQHAFSPNKFRSFPFNMQSASFTYIHVSHQHVYWNYMLLTYFCLMITGNYIS